VADYWQLHFAIGCTVDEIVNNALFHSNSHINQLRLKSFTSCAFPGRLSVLDFVIRYTDIQYQYIRLVDMGLLHYCTFGLKAANDAPNVRVGTTR